MAVIVQGTFETFAYIVQFRVAGGCKLLRGFLGALAASAQEQDWGCAVGGELLDPIKEIGIDSPGRCEFPRNVACTRGVPDHREFDGVAHVEKNVIGMV
jgi:hypothetical protein